MHVVKRKEYFGYDYQLEDYSDNDILEVIFEQLGYDYFLQNDEKADLEICLDEFYCTDKIFVDYEGDEIEFNSGIESIDSETIINFLKNKGLKF